jgi:putative tryptophan/tyrosine transport system substrate-binding protein
MLSVDWLEQRMQFDQLKRREVIALLGAATAWPLTAQAQQPSVPVIGFLSSRSPSESEGVVTAFRRGLRETGFIEGRNLAIAFRWAEGRYDRLPALATELVDLPVTLIFAAGGPPSAFAAKAATSTIPIVFSAVTDPVEIGLVPSLNPGSNITGMALFNASLTGKRLQLTKELVPAINVFVYLLNPSTQSSELEGKGAREAALALGVELRFLNARSEHELDTAFGALSKVGAGAVIVAGEPFFDSQRERIVALAARERVPAIFAFREYVLGGGLMSYGTDLPESYRQAAVYAGRILKGEKPTNLPVMQPTKFHLAVNLKTATALGIEVPLTLLARADEVIE